MMTRDIDALMLRERQLEKAIQRVLDTPAGGMTAEQYKSRIVGGLCEALHARPTPPRIVYTPARDADWRDENEGYVR